MCSVAFGGFDGDFIVRFLGLIRRKLGETIFAFVGAGFRWIWVRAGLTDLRRFRFCGAGGEHWLVRGHGRGLKPVSI